jgi:hypothetical protein
MLATALRVESAEVAQIMCGAPHKQNILRGQQRNISTKFMVL